MKHDPLMVFTAWTIAASISLWLIYSGHDLWAMAGAALAVASARILDDHLPLHDENGEEVRK